MENNNQELNNQVNTNDYQQVQPNNNKILIILMALIIVVLTGYIVYVKFIQKGDNPEPKPNNTEENGNKENNQVNDNSVVQRKLINVTCQDYTETFNNIKIEIQESYDSEVSYCNNVKVYLNNKQVNGINESEQIKSIEFYDSYVILFVVQDQDNIEDDNPNAWLDIINSKDNSLRRVDSTELGYWNPKSYVSTDNSLVITTLNSSEDRGGPTYNGPKNAKYELKYENGVFGPAKELEKYN